MEQKLNIYYDGALDQELEKDLKEAAEKHGWSWYAQGRDFITGRRDLAFYKKELN